MLSITKSLLLSSLLLLQAPSFSAAEDLKVGDTICTEGYIMDFFCINRGRLLDSGLVTLEQPDQHTVHCLVDVGSCIRSPFEVLIDPIEGSSMYSRGFRMTDSSKTKMVELAQSIGSCSTCVNGYSSGMLRKGFRAVMKATVTDLNLGSDAPPTIEIVEMADSSSMSSSDFCKTQFNMTNIVDDLGTNSTLFTVGVESNLRDMQIAHGSLMLASWGFLLPLGAMIAKFFKHRPNGSWYNIHRTCQVVGLIFAVIGWIIALRNFDVFADIGYNNYRHGVCGMATMVLGLLQPLNALIRPHAPLEGETRTTTRFIWEIIHKGFGYSTLLLAVATIILGTTVLPNENDQTAFQISYGILVAILLCVVGWMLLDKTKYSNDSKNATPEQAVRDFERN